jgi:hypothetical protein
MTGPRGHWDKSNDDLMPMRTESSSGGEVAGQPRIGNGAKDVIRPDLELLDNTLGVKTLAS